MHSSCYTFVKRGERTVARAMGNNFRSALPLAQSDYFGRRDTRSRGRRSARLIRRYKRAFPREESDDRSRERRDFCTFDITHRAFRISSDGVIIRSSSRMAVREKDANRFGCRETEFRKTRELRSRIYLKSIRRRDYRCQTDKEGRGTSAAFSHDSDHSIRRQVKGRHVARTRACVRACLYARPSRYQVAAKRRNVERRRRVSRLKSSGRRPAGKAKHKSAPNCKTNTRG